MKPSASLLAPLLTILLVACGGAPRPEPVEASSASEPSASEPSASEPSASEPSTSEPSASEPSTSEPSASEPSVYAPLLLGARDFGVFAALDADGSIMAANVAFGRLVGGTRIVLPDGTEAAHLTDDGQIVVLDGGGETAHIEGQSVIATRADGSSVRFAFEGDRFVIRPLGEPEEVELIVEGSVPESARHLLFIVGAYLLYRDAHTSGTSDADPSAH